jgi:hypothetical protein
MGIDFPDSVFSHGLTVANSVRKFFLTVPVCKYFTGKLDESVPKFCSLATVKSWLIVKNHVFKISGL